MALDRHAWPAAHSLAFCLLVGPRPPHSSSAPLSLVHSRRCYSPSSPRRVRFQLVSAGGAREPRGRRPRRGRGAPLSRAWWGGRRAVCACARLPVPRTASSRRALRPRRDIVRAHGPRLLGAKESVRIQTEGRALGRPLARRPALSRALTVTMVTRVAGRAKACGQGVSRKVGGATRGASGCPQCPGDVVSAPGSPSLPGDAQVASRCDWVRSREQNPVTPPPKNDRASAEEPVHLRPRPAPAKYQVGDLISLSRDC